MRRLIKLMSRVARVVRVASKIRDVNVDHQRERETERARETQKCFNFVGFYHFSINLSISHGFVFPMFSVISFKNSTQ